MLKYIIKRVVLILFTLFIILSLAYILMQFTVDPFQRTNNYYIGERAATQGRFTWENAVDYAVKEGWGERVDIYEIDENGDPVLDKDGKPVIKEIKIVRISVMKKYWNWLKNAVRGKWGVSLVIEYGEDPWVMVTELIPYTIRLNILPLLISTPLGFLFGIIAALRKNKPIDYIISLAVIICISVPSFVFITLLMINATKMGLPIQFSSADSVSWKDYVIPTIALSWVQLQD